MAGTKGHSGGARKNTGRPWTYGRLKNARATIELNGHPVDCTIEIDPKTGAITIRLTEDVLRIEQDAPRK